MEAKDVVRYMDLRRRADSTPGPEAESARKMATDMEAAHPGIAFKAAAFERVMVSSTPFPDFAGAENAGPAAASKGKWVTFVESVVLGAAQRVANDVVQDLTGAGRQDALPRGDLVVKPLPCRDDQVCVEVRVNVADLRGRRRDALLDAVCDELTSEARRR